MVTHHCYRWFYLTDSYKRVFSICIFRFLVLRKSKEWEATILSFWSNYSWIIEAVTDFIFVGSKITADGDCRHEIKKHLFLWRKAMNLDNISKSKDISLLTKVHIVKAMVFPVIMYEYESWTLKKANHWKNWCFWTVVLEKILESPLDSKEIKSVNLKGDQPWIFTGRNDAAPEAPRF